MDLGYKLFKTLDFLFGFPSKINKYVHELYTHEEMNNLIEYKQKKAIIDKLKEKYGLTGSNDKNGDTFCTIELDLYNKKWVVISCKNKTYYNRISNYDNFFYIPDFKWKWPEPIDNGERCSFYIRQKNCQNDYYLTCGHPVPIKEDATFEEVEAILLRLMKRFKELQVEYKEKKAADDFDKTAGLFESLKSHYHLIEPENSINAIRYAYSPDIRYFVISYCKARNQIYVPSGVVQQEIVLGREKSFKLQDCWEMEYTEQTISATTFDEYKKYLDGILKQYKNLEQNKWEKYDI